MYDTCYNPFIARKMEYVFYDILVTELALIIQVILSSREW